MDKQIIILISQSSDSYGAYAENVPGIYGAGDTIDQVKENIKEAISLFKENNPESEWPEAIKENWQIKWYLMVEIL